MRRRAVILRVSPCWDATPEELRLRGVARGPEAAREAAARKLEDEWRRRSAVRQALRQVGEPAPLRALRGVR